MTSMIKADQVKPQDSSTDKQKTTNGIVTIIYRHKVGKLQLSIAPATGSGAAVGSAVVVCGGGARRKRRGRRLGKACKGFPVAAAVGWLSGDNDKKMEDIGSRLQDQWEYQLWKNAWNAFSETNGEDAVEHIENLLEVIDLIKVPKVEENPWTSNEKWAEPMSDIRNLIRYESYEWYDTIEDSELKKETLNNKRVLEESMNEKEESSDDERSLDSPVDEQEDYEHAVNIGADVNSNYNPYLDISRVFIDHRRRSEDEIVQDETELNNDEGDDMGHLDDHLVHENEPFNIKEEGFNE
ncbi:hypothetical protein Tco_1111910 [Tanacetum coccineum]|uniref:Uncharacterized protein n=1 Tax=Tanacetum coccineum TaxID=301880 RepID=A0ABQ5IMZ0_9ASTR